MFNKLKRIKLSALFLIALNAFAGWTGNFDEVKKSLKKRYENLGRHSLNFNSQEAFKESLIEQVKKIHDISQDDYIVARVLKTKFGPTPVGAISVEIKTQNQTTAYVLAQRRTYVEWRSITKLFPSTKSESFDLVGEYQSQSMEWPKLNELIKQAYKNHHLNFNSQEDFKRFLLKKIKEFQLRIKDIDYRNTATYVDVYIPTERQSNVSEGKIYIVFQGKGKPYLLTKHDQSNNLRFVKAAHPTKYITFQITLSNNQDMEDQENDIQSDSFDEQKKKSKKRKIGDSDEESNYKDDNNLDNCDVNDNPDELETLIEENKVNHNKRRRKNINYNERSEESTSEQNDEELPVEIQNQNTENNSVLEKHIDDIHNEYEIDLYGNDVGIYEEKMPSMDQLFVTTYEEVDHFDFGMEKFKNNEDERLLKRFTDPNVSVKEEEFWTSLIPSDDN